MTYIAVEQAVERSPAQWEWVSLRRVAKVRREVNAERRELLLSLSAERGIEARAEGGGRQLASEATERSYWVVHPDDLVFNPMWALEGGVAVSQVRGAVSTAYRVYELSERLHPRFLHHYLRSKLALEQYRALVRGVTTFDRAVTREDLDGMPVPLPSIWKQRAIANYLDTETARIGGLIATKLRLMGLIHERFRAQVDELTGGARARVPVRRLVSQITSGPRGWGERVGNAGRPFIRSANLQRESLSLRTDNLALVDVERTAEAARSSVRPGDVLVGITGANTGWVGMVPSTLTGGYVSQHVAILRPARNCASAWLAYSVFSLRAQEQLLAGQYGGTKQQLGLNDLADLAVGLPTREQQEAACMQLDAAWSATERALTAIHHQVRLLREHSQALITAAVTGELELPGVA